MANNNIEENVDENLNLSADNGYEKPTPPKGYVGYVTIVLVSAVATLFGVLWQSTQKSAKEAKDNLTEYKKEFREKERTDSIIIESLNQQLIHCSDNAILDLQIKYNQAKDLQIMMEKQFQRTTKETQLTRQNVAEVKKATAELKKTINSNQ